MLQKLDHNFIQFEPHYRRVVEEDGLVPAASANRRTANAISQDVFAKYRVGPPKWLLLKNPWPWFMPDFLSENFAQDR